MAESPSPASNSTSCLSLGPPARSLTAAQHLSYTGPREEKKKNGARVPETPTATRNGPRAKALRPFNRQNATRSRWMCLTFQRTPLLYFPRLV